MYRFAPERVLDVVNESRTFISSNVLNGAQRLNDLNDLNKLLVTAVSEVPNVTGHKTAAGAGHDSLLECDFHAQKSTAKDLNGPYATVLCRRINNLRRSDPARNDDRRLSRTLTFFALIAAGRI
jgi:hypothetical protein